MIPVDGEVIKGPEGVPRVGGGDPQSTAEDAAVAMCSPRRRG